MNHYPEYPPMSYGQTGLAQKKQEFAAEAFGLLNQNSEQAIAALSQYNLLDEQKPGKLQRFFANTDDANAYRRNDQALTKAEAPVSYQYGKAMGVIKGVTNFVTDYDHMQGDQLKSMIADYVHDSHKMGGVKDVAKAIGFATGACSIALLRVSKGM